MTTQRRGVPDIHPVQSDYRIGAHYFPGWKHGDHWGWSKIAPQVTDRFGCLDAVREIFSRCDNTPDNRLPGELGFGPYDAGYTAVNEHEMPNSD